MSAIANGASNGSPANGQQQSALSAQVQQMLTGMTKERLHGMIARMQQLKASGVNESTSQEYANLVNTLKMFQQYQAMRQQQAVAMQARAAQQHTAARSPTAAAAAAPSPSAPSPSAPSPSQAAAASKPIADASNGASSTNGVVVKTEEDFSRSLSPANLTPDQLNTLKTQINAFKLISRNQPLPSHLQEAILAADRESEAKAEPLSSASQIAAAAVASSDKAPSDESAKASISKDPAVSSTNSNDKVAETARPPSPKDDPSSSVYPYNAYVHPFSYISKPLLEDDDYTATKQQRLLIPSLMPAGLEPRLLLEERDRFVQARIRQRIRELESFPADMSQNPTMATLKGKENAHDFTSQLQGGQGGHNAKLKALIELKSLHLLEKQKQLREQVVQSMNLATTLGLDRVAFRRVKKQTLRDARMTEQLERKQRVEREKRARQKHIDYLSTICNHGRDLVAAHTKANEQARRFGRAMLKFHADSEREEQKRVERIAKERLNALKADDEEAYLKLIDTAKDTRITHLLRQTDAYLDSLAQAVQAQQNDDVHAEAIAAERIVEDTSNQEVGVAVDETMFGATRQDDPSEDRGKVDYYSVAHRITERIAQQPAILSGGTLKEYQIKGLQWMISLYNNRLNGILADEMGLGKTIQTISLITYLMEFKKQNGPFLVIVPLSTLTNWVNEFNKWAPTVSTLVYKGTPNVRKQLTGRLRSMNFQVLLTTYEYIIKDKHLLGKIKWVHMIIDEGHRMKNTQSKLTITLTQFYTSRYRLLLTGTPLQNNLPELWALLNFVLPRIFNSVKSFDEWFNTPFTNTGNEGGMMLNEEEALLIIKRLHKVLRPFLLRRLKKDVASELPDKVEKVIKCKMSALQLKLYQQMKKHKMILSGEDNTQAGKKAKPQGIRGLQNAIMQLRKICNHPYVFEQVELAINPTKENGPDLYRSAGKFELLDRLLPKLFATKHRVLIFFQMTAIMDIMEDFLRYRGFKYLRLDGSTKPDDRSQLLKLFNTPGSDYFIFILSTRAGGLGLNLQSADTVIIYDSDWNPHQDLQAQDRAHRIGQKMEVRILRLVTEKSVEETILARAQDKLEIEGKVIQAGKFDNQATADERELLLRAMLEADNDDEDEDDGEFNDDELNQLLARGEHEVPIFQQIDKERNQADADFWKSLGYKGKLPERLMQETELPAVYQQDFDADNVLAEVVEEEPATRKRNVVHYDDGLTEDQFLRALEDDDVDLNDIVERKRERIEKRRAKAMMQPIDSTEGTPDPESGRRKKVGRGRGGVSETPEPSPGPSARKRKRFGNVSMDGSPDYEESPSASRIAQPKRRKTGGEDDVRDRIKYALNQCYRAVETCLEPESGRKRCLLFLDVPKKTDYPDYHVIIEKPIAMRQIKRRIDNRTFRRVDTCRDEFHLMVRNAKTYNQEGSWVYNDAVELQKAFDTTYDMLCRFSGLPGSENEGEVAGGGDGDTSIGGDNMQGVGEEVEEEGEDEDEDEKPAAPAPRGIKIKLGKRKPAAQKGKAIDSEDEE
ncbi:probable SNF2 - component of SWI/SNF global transcription activator complex [Melanopsichium pennsylvanicum]|uniref:Probable SNF2 - component of SWI/SNF global transcription activator complex n=2 Tax=Melanopsichium pennsylvanicum TaxID=63383 RepID=A0AAJ5C3I6_9BASI|nr:probable SNF2-component of SWI/SNF global transcription activator complex [Melanopsichium pennsylvanicum 4]SNX82573.1 probable SNF2 - component of SWI/SNF global transcription activator complex [Melanopsichium pennsylvanicum]